MRVRQSYTVGMVHRKEFRRTLLAWGLDFTEDKSWTNSLFVVAGEESLIDSINTLVQEHQDRMSEAR